MATQRVLQPSSSQRASSQACQGVAVSCVVPVQGGPKGSQGFPVDSQAFPLAFGRFHEGSQGFQEDSE